MSPWALKNEKSLSNFSEKQLLRMIKVNPYFIQQLKIQLTKCG
jgi:hypothetical protein